MKKLTAILFHLSLLLFTFVLSAAVPLRWTVETSCVKPAQFEAYHGETIEFAAAMQTYGRPLAITNDLIGIYWQTNGMGSAYWTAPAVLSNNVMIARWTPEMDVGANVYSCFIGAPGEIYRAAFQLRLRPSPGAVPSELPLPIKTLDFSLVAVLNAPYYSKSETDARIIELSPPADLSPAFAYTTAVSNKMEASKQDVIADLASIRSGAALGATAVQPAAISDMETKTHAAATYQPIGQYLTVETDPTVPAWAKATSKPSYTAGEVGVTMGSGAQSVAIAVGSSAATMPTFDFFSQMLTYKQDTISDLANIRSGAALGATAVQPSAIGDMETKTHAAATYQPIGQYLTVETDPTVATKISNHNSSSTAHQDIRQTMVSKYSKPAAGIPKSDLASAVQTSLGKADTALQQGDIFYMLDKRTGGEIEGLLDGKAGIAADNLYLYGLPDQFPLWFHSSDGLDAKFNGFQFMLHGNAQVDLPWTKPAGSYTLATTSDIPTSMAWGSITGKPSWIGSSKPSYTWTEIGSKPTTFTPSAHSHAQSDVTGLSAALAGKRGMTDRKWYELRWSYTFYGDRAEEAAAYGFHIQFDDEQGEWCVYSPYGPASNPKGTRDSTELTWDADEDWEGAVLFGVSMTARLAAAETTDTLALTSEVPTPVEVIDPASATSSGKAADALATKTALTGKASRAANPTAGHIAALDADGNPTDSGKTPADFGFDEKDVKFVYDENGTKRLDVDGKIYQATVETGGHWFMTTTTDSMILPYLSHGSDRYMWRTSDARQAIIYVPNEGKLYYNGSVLGTVPTGLNPLAGDDIPGTFTYSSRTFIFTKQQAQFPDEPTTRLAKLNDIPDVSLKADKTDVEALADNVSTWSSYWSGDDVRVTVTNYDSAVNLPSLYLEYKLSNGLFRTVWDERTRWNANELRMAALESAVEGKADRAWGYYDSHTGGWAPDGYTWLSSPKIAISGGLAYQKHVTSEGAVWVLESNGLVAESGGVMSNGFFRISDDEGNPLFEIVKGDKRTVGATAGSCEPLAGYAITHLQIGYAVESADHPKIYVTRSLTPVDWKDEEDADCPATVNWSGSSGNWTAVVAGKVAEALLFVKAEYEVGGNTYIKQSAPVSVQKLVLGGNEYRVGTATISGHTVLTLTLEP